MKEAQPGAYFKRYAGGYVIAHKYGYLDGAINDVGIIYADTPFLLAAFTYNHGNGEEVLGRLCELLCGYTDEQTAQREAKAAERAARKAQTIADYEARLAEAEAAAAETAAPEEAEAPPAPEPEEAPAPGAPERPRPSARPVWMIAAASAAGLVLFALYDRRRKHLPV